MNEKKPSSPLFYRDSGVDINAGQHLVETIKPFAQKTWREGVFSGIGGFSALFSLSQINQHYLEPILVSSADGVGTKLKFAQQLNCHATIGQDLVAMSVNDILTQGAEPLFFLDYFACGTLKVEVAAQVIEGIAQGCALAGCALIGGETAEMPGMYTHGEYDLAGFAVGVVEKNKRIDGAKIAEGDVVLGIASSGLHSNGYSLVRHLLEQHAIELTIPFEQSTLAEMLMVPTKIYVQPMLQLLKKCPIKGIAHITGGGLLDNIPRILPKTLAVTLNSNAWPRPALFQWLAQQGQIEAMEMLRVFNCGIGLVLILEQKYIETAQKYLTEAGEYSYLIGEVCARGDGTPIIVK